MIRGETVTMTMSGFPIPVASIKSLHIVFKTASQVLLEKTLEDCSVLDEVITLKLSQEDSLKLTVGPIQRNIIVVTDDGSRFECGPFIMCCYPSGKPEVME